MHTQNCENGSHNRKQNKRDIFGAGDTGAGHIELNLEEKLYLEFFKEYMSDWETNIANLCQIYLRLGCK